MKKGDYKNFAKFTGKHLCKSLFFEKAAAVANNSGRLFKVCAREIYEKFVYKHLETIEYVKN